MKRIISAAIVVGFLSACTTLADVPTRSVGRADLRLANGTAAGTVIVTANSSSLTLSLAAVGMPAGSHGAHLHQVGSCEGPAFTTAGGHLNPMGHQHGTENPAGSHLGDLPNLQIAGNGTGALTAQLQGTISQSEAALFDGDGTAIVIHADADDYKTDPTGNSGGRIACGVLKRS